MTIIKAAQPVEPTYLTVSEAVALAAQVGTEGTSEKQYVTGTVKSISNPTYGEMYITDGVIYMSMVFIQVMALQNIVI